MPISPLMLLLAGAPPPKPAAPAPVPTGPAVSLDRAAQAGTWTVTMKGEFETPAEVWTMEGTVEETTKVEADGTLGLLIVPKETKMTIRGETITVPGGPSVRQTVGKGGEPLTVASDYPSLSAWRAARLQAYVSPPGPVALEGTWKAERPEEKANKLPSVARLYRYLGEESRDGVTFRKVRVEARETGGLVPASLEATVWLNQAGEIAEWQSQWRSLPLDDSGRTADAKITTVRTPVKT